MYVKRICYPVNVLGPGNRLGIWVAGCNRKCFGCMSPELQTKEGCKNATVSEVIDMLKKITGPIDGVTISGGEPFLYSEELKDIIEYINKHISNDIIVYTGYTLQELKEQESVFIDNILSNISVLIDGEYKDSMNDGVGLRGSSNQEIHIFKNVRDYGVLLDGKRELQSFRYNNQILVIGIQ